MTTATLTSKGQITIPAEVRHDLKVDAGDRVEFIQIAPGRYEFVAATQSITDLKDAQWASTSVSFNAENDLIDLFAQHGLPAPQLMFQANSALSLMVALSSTDLIALLPVQWNDFHLTKDTLQVIPIKETLPAPSIVCIQRPGLPLTPAAQRMFQCLKSAL
jgi:AbrB family looped-hinge helix DNA binding protein